MANKINIGTEINLDDLLQSRLLIQANSGGGKSGVARVLIEETFGTVPFIILDVEGEYYTLKEKYGDVLIVGGHYADIPISLKSAKLLPREIISNRLSVVIDLGELQMNDRILYAKYFLESMMDLPKEYWLPYLVFIEEAHKLCGEQDKQVSAGAVKDLMTRGRKRGYCGILITQRISKLHKDAAAEANNKFIGRTFLDIDMERSAKELGFTSRADALKLRDLKQRQFFAFGTSIHPHHVHEVTIKEAKTKFPKSGSVIEIKPQKPTDKLLKTLAKLNDLPAEAAKELKNIQELQKEVSRLNTELRKTSQPLKKVKLSEDHSKCNQKIAELQQELKENDKLLLDWKKLCVSRGVLLGKLKEQISNHLSGNADLESVTKFPKNETIVPKPVTNFRKNDKSFQPANSGNGILGRCPLSIFKFLASFPSRSWTRAQIGIATGYSPSSGGFNNSLSELNTKGLVVKDGSKIMYNSAADVSEYLGSSFEPQQYSIDTFKNKLGKCERKIYEVLLDHPHDSFAKDDLANATPSQYSYSSGGFNNAISTLNTLELIKRENGKIRLNPELLEI